jgi:hypothetical protein
MEKLNYESIMALVKKYCNLIPDLSPARKHEMEALCTPDCIYSYADGVTEAEYVSSRWTDVVRYVLYYEPHPCYIHVDDRQHTADCVFKEEVRDPATGELIKDYWDKWKPGLGGIVYLRESFGFMLHDGKVKIKHVFMGPKIDVSEAFMDESWRRWRDLSKP